MSCSLLITCLLTSPLTSSWMGMHPGSLTWGMCPRTSVVSYPQYKTDPDPTLGKPCGVCFLLPDAVLHRLLHFGFWLSESCASWCWISGCSSVPCSALHYSLSTNIFFYDRFPFISSPWLVLDFAVLRYSALLLLLKLIIIIFANFPLVGQICSSSWCLCSKLCGSQTLAWPAEKQAEHISALILNLFSP